MLKDIWWSVKRSLSHYRTCTTKSSRIYYNAKYLERCAECARRNSYATHSINKSNSKLAWRHHPSSVPSMYEKSQRPLPSLSVHFIDTVENTLKSISCFTRKILPPHCKDRHGSAAYCEKRTEHIITLCGHVQRIRKLELTIFLNNQLDAKFFFMYLYFNSLHVSDSSVSIIRRINCINTISGICHSV